MKEIIYCLMTSDGEYEDYRCYELYRNKNKEIVEEVKTQLESKLKEIANTLPKGVTKNDINKYTDNENEKLSDNKWNKIYKYFDNKYKIEGLSWLTIVEEIINDDPDINGMIEYLGIEK